MLFLDRLPAWNKRIGLTLEPYGPVINTGLVVVIVISLWALWKWRRQYKALWLAYLVSP